MDKKFFKVTIESQDISTATTHSLTYFNEPNNPAKLPDVIAALVVEHYPEIIDDLIKSLGE